MEEGSESDSALSGQTEKHIVSLDALCNLAPFSPQSEKSMASETPTTVTERQRKSNKETAIQKERAHCSRDKTMRLKDATGQTQCHKLSL